MPPAGHENTRNKNRLNRSGARRLGDDYQDAVAIDYLTNWLGANDEYEWIKVEADDALYLDDITAKRRDGTFVYRQVKYSTSSSSEGDPWTWEKLLDRGSSLSGRRGLSLLEKWHKSFDELSRRNEKIDAAVVSNRKPGLGLRESLSQTGYVLVDRLASDVRTQIIEQLGSKEAAEGFFRSFHFEPIYPELKELELGCRQRFRKLGGTEEGWLALKDAVSLWVCHKDEPRTGGQITLQDVRQAARWHELEPVSQQFEVPIDFVLASKTYPETIARLLLEPSRRCLVLTGSPGSGKSTFTSHLYSALRDQAIPVIRHHYYIPSTGDLSPHQRARHLIAARSLMHDLRRDYAESLGMLAARNPVPNVDELKAWLVEAGKFYQSRGTRVVMIIDGLDHVWREHQSVEELTNLLGPLLPPPNGVVLLLVTQPVTDSRLPVKLLSVAPRHCWMSLELLNARAVTLWIHRYLKSVGRAEWLDRKQGRIRGTRELGQALWKHSSGHPLHLRYTLRALIERGLEPIPTSLALLPGCPSEDITEYYRHLWTALGEVAREILHLVASCGFEWPSQGLPEAMEILGYSRHEAEFAFREVRHLLTDDGWSIRPYHGSLVVFVRDQEAHLEKRQLLLRSALRWLKEMAPEDWRWAYTWSLEADLGDPKPLIDGLTRPWLVEAVAQFRPPGLVNQLVSRGLWHAADRGDLPSLVRISLLCDYSISAFEYNDDIVTSLLSPLLESKNDGSLLRRLRADLGLLHHEALLVLAEHGFKIRDNRLARQCLATLRTRLNDKNYKRHGIQVHRQAIVDACLRTATLDGATEVTAFIDIARRNRESGWTSEVLAISGKELRKVDDGKRLREMVVLAATIPGSGQTQFDFWELYPLVREAALHSLEQGWSLPHLAQTLVDHPLVQIYAAIKGANGFEPGILAFPEPVDPRDQFLSFTQRETDQEEFFRRSFYTLLANSLWEREEPNREWLQKSWGYPWMERFLAQLNESGSILSRAIKCGESLSHRWIYESLGHLPRPVFRGNPNVDEYSTSTSAACAVMSLSFDIHSLLGAAGHRLKITEQDVQLLRSTEYCFFDSWLERYANFDRPLLDETALKKLLQEESRLLTSSMGHLPEHARKFSILARLATIHGETGEAKRFVRHAAECLVAHGSHKDMLLHNVHQSVSICLDGLQGPNRLSRETACSWLERIAAPVVFVGKFTDGDETSHLPADLGSVMAHHFPELLPLYHRWLTEREEYHNASMAFLDFLRTADLKLPFVRSAASTAAERAGRLVLSDRAQAGDVDAQICLDELESVLGPILDIHVDSESAVSSLREKDASPLPSPEHFPPSKFDEFLTALESRYTERDRAITEWAQYWEQTGSEEAILEAFEETYSRGYYAGGFDSAYRIARRLGDRDRAYQWLIRAHCEKSDWYWVQRSETAAAKRWTDLHQHYPERWLSFIRDTIREYHQPHDPAEPWRGTALGNGAFPRLVRYCLAMRKFTEASEIVSAMVDSAIEYVSPVPLPPLEWLRTPADESDRDGQALEILLTRLSWPSSLVRERASSVIASRLSDPPVGQHLTKKLLAWIESRELESVAILGIIPFVKASQRMQGDSPLAGQLAAASQRSLLSRILLAQLDIATKMHSPKPVHSGEPPIDFVADSFFAEHACKFVPPLYWKRAEMLEELGAQGLLRQWGYEWHILASLTHVSRSTRVLDYWFYSSSYKDPNCSADPLMSEVFHSAYLRALAWAAERGHISTEGALDLSAETCPIDFELWKIPPGRRPTWWPMTSLPEEGVDTVPSFLLESIEQLWEGELSGEVPWGHGWSLAHASGRVSTGPTVYDLEISAFLQSSTGTHSPTHEDLTTWLGEHRALKKFEVYFKDSELAFRGPIRAVQPEEAIQELGDWLVLPLAGRVDIDYSCKWQWWRLDRPIWLPLLYSDEGSARFGARDGSLAVHRDDEVLAQWRDWTDGLEETLNPALLPPSGEYLLVRSNDVDDVANRLGMTKAWAIRLTCHHRADQFKKFQTHTFHTVLGARAVTMPPCDGR